MTIYFNSLGNNGHLGNQMFQYAAIRGVAHKRGLDWCIPPKSYFGRNYPLRSNIYDCFELPFVKNKHSGINIAAATIAEREHCYDDWIIENIKDGYNIEGYFQSPKYFNDIEHVIRRDFTFKSKVILSSPPVQENYCSLHVRRTDYVGNSLHHTNLDRSYYEKALEILNPNKVIVFSDDTEWCKSHKLFSNFEISENNEYVDLYLMSNASQHIIANSSFSWWGAWLANSKDVVAPSKWFGPALAHLDTKDYYLEGWKLV